MSYVIGGTRIIWNYSGNNIIDDNAIYAIPNYQNITDMVLPDIVNEVAPFAFSNVLLMVKYISMPSVEIIRGYAFNNCPLLETVYISKCNYLDMGVFDGCLKLTNIYVPSNMNSLNYNPSDFLGSANNNDFFISTDNANQLKTRLNNLGAANTSKFKADRVFVEYKTTTAGITDAITFLHNSVSSTDYETFMRRYTETLPGTGIPASGIHKTIYDNMNLIKNNQLLTSYNNFSELDANYSSITVDLAPHYWKFISAISSTGFVPGVSVQPDTTEFVMTFTSGAFSKKLVYKLNK